MKNIMSTANKYVDYEDNLYELGGFAIEEEDINGNFKEFNSCLADEYILAMIDEDFNALGDLSCYLIENIYKWSKIHNMVNISIDDLFNGSFLTYKNRTFIEAIIQTHAYKAGGAFLHVNNPKFLAMMARYAQSYEYVLGYRSHENLNSEEFNKLLHDTLVELNDIYESINNEEKLILIQRVNRILSNIRVPNGFKPCKAPKNSLTNKLLIKK